MKEIDIQAKHRSGTQKSPLAVISRRIDELKLNPRNPRLHDAKQIRQIARSIRSFGFNVPVLVDANLEVVAGHGRILACKQLGWTDVPTICLEHLSEKQLRAFMIADNRLNEISVWDDRLLAEQLRELSLCELDFDLEATGFEMGEIDLRIEGLNDVSADEPDPSDLLHEEDHGPVVSREGDLFLLGRHRVYCGSALEPNAYAVVMAREKASMVFTDPPYNVRIAGNVSGLGKTTHREFAMGSGEMSEAEFVAFLNRAFTLLGRSSSAGALHFICMDWRHMSELLTAARGIYSELKNLCVWVKDNGGMGSWYRSQHELVFVYRHGDERQRNNVQLGKYGRNRTNVWHYAGANSFSRAGEEGNLLSLHPTVKPVAMVADAIMDCTARNEIVLDPFLGSGTTVIAAERTGRRCYGIEVDPLFVDVIVRRWQAFTRDRALRVSDGRYFDEIEEEVKRGNGK